MAKTVILYHSRYGSTEQYARWIHEAVESEMVPLEKADAVDLSGFDNVLLGCSVRAGKLHCAERFQALWSRIKDKTVVLFAVGATPTRNEKEYGRVLERSLSDDMGSKIEYFPLRGRLNINGLKFADRMMMKMGIIAEKDPRKKEAMREPVDGVKKEALAPLLALLGVE